MEGVNMPQTVTNLLGNDVKFNSSDLNLDIRNLEFFNDFHFAIPDPVAEIHHNKKMGRTARIL
jgi:hypothetical protein